MDDHQMVQDKNPIPVINSCDFYGLKISIFSKDILSNYISSVVCHNYHCICYGYSLGLLTTFSKYPQIYEFAEKFDLMLTDGRAFYWLAKIFGCQLRSDISIPRFVFFCLELANQNNFSVELYGASTDSNQRACDEIRKKYPQIVLKKGVDGFTYDEEYAVRIIQSESPDILLIGLPSPQKEEFSSKYKDLLPCKVIIPCGGVIDTLSGKTKLTPIWLKKLGFAWLFRFIQQPRQRFKITTETIISVMKLLPLLSLAALRNKKYSIPKFFGYNS